MADITNDTLKQILSSVQQYRDDLVAKLNETGAELASDATLYEALQKVSGQGPSGVDAVAGYIVNQDGKLVFKSLQDSSSLSMSSLYVPDTPEQPQYSAASGGGSMNFYKCTSVDTANNKWAGRKAVLSEGKYSFESDSTQDLTYTSITPAVNGIYSGDALVIVKTMYEGMPTNGLVFYAPLDESKAYAETGQSLSASGSPTYQTFNGIPCVHLPSGTWMTSTLTGATSMSAFTMTAWRYSADANYGYHYGITADSWDRQFLIDNGTMYYDSGAYVTNLGGATNTWYFEAAVWNGSTLTFYRDLEQKGQASISSGVLMGNSIVLGAQNTNGTGSNNNIYLAAFRIYNRALSSSEITALASEFTPTA